MRVIALFGRGNTPERKFKPFEQWANTKYKSQPWYKSDINVKHNRYTCVNETIHCNLMNAVARFLCILHAQIGENMVETAIEACKCRDVKA